MSKENSKRRIREITAFAAALLMAAAFSAPAGTEIMGVRLGSAIVASADTVASGWVTGVLKWDLDDTGTLTISYTGSGSGGAMTDWTQADYYKGKIPWNNYKDDIKSVVIGEKVTSIGNYAFYMCSNITSVNMGSVTSIGRNAFQGCTGLTNITIPDSVTSIGDGAFQNCTNLSSVSFGVSPVLTTIGLNAFNECTNLENITIPESVISIGECAFQYCTKLTSITIPKSVTFIGSTAFANCSNLTGITVDENNPNYSSESGVLFDKNKTILLKYPINKSETSYGIPDSVTSIEISAFSGCTRLESVTIPNNPLENILLKAVQDLKAYFCLWLQLLEPTQSPLRQHR